MESMTQELNIENHSIKSIKKLFCNCCNNNLYYNAYTLVDVEEGKKKVYLHLLRKYNYESKEYIQSFINQAAELLINDLFQSGQLQTHTRTTAMMGTREVIQDPRRLNPENRNSYYRIISVDSSFRSNMWFSNYMYDSLSSSNMMVEFNDTLDDVTSLELTNINIPFTFYNIDESYGNNYFYVEMGDTVAKVEIPSGNYNTTTLITAINDACASSEVIIVRSLVFSINTNTRKTTIQNTNADAANTISVIFYDHLDENRNNTTFSSKKSKYNNQAKLNNNLGWILGFRDINANQHTLDYDVPPQDATVESEMICYIPYTKYFVVVIDDMNKNQTNKGLVQISDSRDFIQPTKYFNSKDNSLNCLTDGNFDNFVNESGRNMTKNQLYSALQINNFRKSVHNKNSKLDTHSVGNVFGIIPFENKSLVWGESMFTSDKNRFKRVYHGPVDISKMKIQLLDDRGNLLNLNGNEWSMTLISTHLYRR